jgi:putative molybdopterin biosynthesis protein
VASGNADAAFGIEAVASAMGLAFIALAQEDYFLATLAENLEQPHVVGLRRALASAGWQSALRSVPGYVPRRSGEVLSLKAVLPWWNYRKPKRLAPTLVANRKAKR